MSQQRSLPATVAPSDTRTQCETTPRPAHSHAAVVASRTHPFTTFTTARSRSLAWTHARTHARTHTSRTRKHTQAGGLLSGWLDGTFDDHAHTHAYTHCCVHAYAHQFTFVRSHVPCNARAQVSDDQFGHWSAATIRPHEPHAVPRTNASVLKPSWTNWYAQEPLAQHIHGQAKSLRRNCPPNTSVHMQRVCKS